MGLLLAHAVMKSGIGLPTSGVRVRVGNRVRGPRRDHAIRLVALVLAIRADDASGQKLFPRVATVANDTGLHRSQVLRALRRLRDAGILEVEQPARGWKTTRYRFAAEKLPP